MSEGKKKSRLVPGQILNETYQINGEIGEGSGGIVYKAIHMRLNEEVVIKEIKNTKLNKNQSRKEADILKKLKHPYLPRVYDFVEEDGIIYTVMDFIDGEDLSDILMRQGAFSQEQVKKWAQQLGEALAYLHQQEPPIIHSDIKPSNIMITRDGNVCLIDFNVSLAMGQENDNKVGGSIGYAPPEQYSSLNVYIARMEAKLSHLGELPYQKNVSVLDTEGITDQDETEILSDEATEVLSDDATEILEDDGTEVLSDDATEVLSDGATEVLNGENPKQEFFKESGSKAQIIITPEMADFYRLNQYQQYIGRGIDTRSDIYSLGVTLYVLLTGKNYPLIYGDESVKEELSQLVSEGFLHILLKMLELEPGNRYQDGSEYLNELSNCHKYDSKYIKRRRKQMIIQIAFVLGIAAVAFMLIFGIRKYKAEKENIYHTILQEAVTAIEQQNYEQAGTLIAEAKEMDSEKVNAYKEELYLLYSFGKYEECLKTGQTYINAPAFYISTKEDKSAMGDILYIVANACYKLKDYENAKTLFEGAIEQDSANSAYYRDYAICLAKTGDTELAMEQLEKGIACGMSEDSLYMAKGEIAAVTGDDKEAIQNFQICIDMTEDLQIKTRAVLATVEVYRQNSEDRVDEEIQFMESYIRENGESGNLMIVEYLADSYSRKASVDKENADEYYQKALELFEQLYHSGYTTYQVQENIVILHENMGNLEEAESRLLEMAESYPKRYEVYKRLAYLEADKQQNKANEDRIYQQMKKYYNQAMELYTTDKQDMEMEMLKNMITELENGGWF